MKKKIMTLCMTILMAALTAGTFVISADAASRDVTAKMSQDKNMKRICKMAAAYTTAMKTGGSDSTGTVKITLNNNSRLSIAAFVRYNYKGDYRYTAKELQAETKALFGKKAGTGSIKALGKTDMLVCSSTGRAKTPYIYCGGDFGDMIPRYKITSIKALGRGTYEVSLENLMGVYGEKGTEKIGNTVLRLQKNAASAYGYNIKGITYR